MSPNKATHIAFFWFLFFSISSCHFSVKDELEQKQNAHKPYINLTDAAITSGNLERAVFQMDSVFRGIKIQIIGISNIFMELVCGCTKSSIKTN